LIVTPIVTFNYIVDAKDGGYLKSINAFNCLIKEVPIKARQGPKHVRTLGEGQLLHDPLATKPWQAEQFTQHDPFLVMNRWKGVILQFIHAQGLEPRQAVE
jgi:hypothetical protein